MRKALVVGIDKYKGSALRSSVNDAIALATTIETHANGDPNFSVLLATKIETRAELTGLIQKLFNDDSDVALFYFSGHGYEDELGTYLVTPDVARFDMGVSLADLMVFANHSKAKNRIIILDCCRAGAAGTAKNTGSASVINSGVTILTASRPDEAAMESSGHGVFTNLLIAALQGGAADIRGDITPGSIYAYIDQALGAWDQRPVFKTNITSFISLRNIQPRVPAETLRKLTQYFETPQTPFQLDSSFEDSNSPDVKHELVLPHAIPENVLKFKDLQKFQSAGLVIPVDAPYMYFAAIRHKSCRLTALGYHYWRLVKEGKV